MKNNKLLYLLTIIITLFTFNTKVNAAQELTCVYEEGELGYKLGLVQFKSGEINIYKNEKKEDVNGKNWQIANYDFIIKVPNDNNGYSPVDEITTCPKRVAQKSGTYIFSNEISNITKANLEQNGEYKEIKIIPTTLTETKTGITENVSCDTLMSISNGDSIIIEKLDNSRYDLSCIYAKDIRGMVYNGLDEYSGCHVVQLDIKETGETFVRENYPFNPHKAEYVQYNGHYFIKLADINIEGTKIKNSNAGWCPNQIYIKRDEYSSENTSMESGIGIYSISTQVSLNAINGYDVYSLKKTVGYNLETGEKHEGEPSSIIVPQVEFLGCDSLFEGDEGENLKRILSFAINVIKILIPVLLIGLGIMDFAKAIFSSSEDNMKKTQAKFIKRLILAVCIFLIPTIITFVLEIFKLVWDKNISTDFCGILK